MDLKYAFDRLKGYLAGVGIAYTLEDNVFEKYGLMRVLDFYKNEICTVAQVKHPDGRSTRYVSVLDSYDKLMIPNHIIEETGTRKPVSMSPEEAAGYLTSYVSGTILPCRHEHLHVTDTRVLCLDCGKEFFTGEEWEHRI